MPPELLKQLAAASVPVALMFYAIRWLVGANEKQQESNRELVQQLNAERSDRLDKMETHIRECDEDRRNLRAELLRIARARNSDEEVPHDPPTRHHLPRASATSSGPATS